MEASEAVLAGRSFPRRGRIAVRLLAAFLIVSILPISILGYLSWRESGAASEEGSTEEAHSAEEIFGMSTASVELAVAAASLLLSIGMALLVARTLVGPLRRLQASMRRVSAIEMILHPSTVRTSWNASIPQ